jgi:hypothetical protein
MDYPIKKGVPTKGKANCIAPEGSAKKKNPAMETSLFGESALGSEIAPTKKYAKSGKKGEVNKGVVSTKANQISPDANY